MKYKIRICQGVNCQNYLSEDLFREAQKLTSDNPNIEVEKRSCMNLCESAPNMEIIDEDSNKREIVNNLDYSKLEQFIKQLAES